MPQDELWRCSARATGFIVSYHTPDEVGREHGLMRFSTMWSKTPTGRSDEVFIKVPAYASWYLPEIIKGGVDQFLGGDPAEAGRAARATSRTVLQGFETGLHA